MLTKEQIEERVSLKREYLTRQQTADVEKYLIKVTETLNTLTRFKDVATEILDGRVAVHGDEILTLLRRVAETRAEIRPELMNETQKEKAILFAQEQVNAGQWVKFMTVSNAKKLFDKAEVEAIKYDKPIKAQFKLREEE